MKTPRILSRTLRWLGIVMLNIPHPAMDGASTLLPVQIELISDSRISLSWKELTGVDTYTLYHATQPLPSGSAGWLQLVEVVGMRYETDLTGSAGFFHVRASGGSLYAETMAVLELARQTFLNNFEAMDPVPAMEGTAALLETDARVEKAACDIDAAGLPTLHVELANGLIFLMPVFHSNLPDEAAPAQAVAMAAPADKPSATHYGFDGGAPSGDLLPQAESSVAINLPENPKALFIDLSTEASNLQPFMGAAESAGYKVDYKSLTTVETYTALANYGLVGSDQPKLL